MALSVSPARTPTSIHQDGRAPCACSSCSTTCCPLPQGLYKRARRREQRRRRPVGQVERGAYYRNNLKYKCRPQSIALDLLWSCPPSVKDKAGVQVRTRMRMRPPCRPSAKGGGGGKRCKERAIKGACQGGIFFNFRGDRASSCVCAALLLRWLLLIARIRWYPVPADAFMEEETSGLSVLASLLEYW